MIGNFFTLADYLGEVRDLLHDPGSQYWNRAQLVAYINDGIRHRDLDTGQNRVQFPFTLTVNTDTYSLHSVASQNPDPPQGPTDILVGATAQTIFLDPDQTLGYQVLATTSWGATVTISNSQIGHFDADFSTAAPAGAKLYWQLYAGAIRPNASRVFDIIGMNLLYNNLRIVMGQFSLTELNASVRQYTPPLSWAPVRWARQGPFAIIVAPAPSTAYVTEWDCSTYAAPLVYDQDADLMPYPYTEAVPFYAAYRAKLNERQMPEAAAFLDQYRAKVNDGVNNRAGMVPSMYSSGVTRI